MDWRREKFNDNRGGIAVMEWGSNGKKGNAEPPTPKLWFGAVAAGVTFFPWDFDVEIQSGEGLFEQVAALAPGPTPDDPQVHQRRDEGQAGEQDADRPI